MPWGSSTSVRFKRFFTLATARRSTEFNCWKTLRAVRSISWVKSAACCFRSVGEGSRALPIATPALTWGSWRISSIRVMIPLTRASPWSLFNSAALSRKDSAVGLSISATDCLRIALALMIACLSAGVSFACTSRTESSIRYCKSRARWFPLVVGGVPGCVGAGAAASTASATAFLALITFSPAFTTSSEASLVACFTASF